MNREEDPHLWDLLGRAKNTRPSPFFARNVLRRIRDGEKQEFAGWLSWRRLVPTLSAATAVLLVVFALHAFPPHHRRSNQLATVENQDADVAADFEVLAGNDDDNDDAALL